MNLLPGPSHANLPFFVTSVEWFVALKTLEYFMETSASDWSSRLSEYLLLMPFVVRQQETEPCVPQECVVVFAFLKVCSFVPDQLLQPRWGCLWSRCRSHRWRRNWVNTGFAAVTGYDNNSGARAGPREAFVHINSHCSLYVLLLNHDFGCSFTHPFC